MKVGVLAGGLGLRLAPETLDKPKPMTEIGGFPILWHILNIYAAAGYHEFVIALGHKSGVIKDYFVNYPSHTSLTVDLATGVVTPHDHKRLNWVVHLLETGLSTQTGGRIRQMAEFIGDETFMVTYGDGVADMDVRRLVEFHRQSGKLATMTVVRAPSPYGVVTVEGDRVMQFKEKPHSTEHWINGGFFVLEPGVRDYIAGDNTVWEDEPLERLVADGQLAAYCHEGFWQSMDTLRDKQYLESLWQRGNAPWKLW